MASVIFYQKLQVISRNDWRMKTKPSKHWHVASQGFHDPGDRLPGVKPETFRLWLAKPGRLPQEESVQNLCDFINAKLVIKTPLELKHFSDEVDFETFCAIVGYDAGQIEFAQYSAIFERDGPQVDYIYRTPAEAETALSRMRSGYSVFRREPESLGGGLTVMGLAVLTAVPPSARKDEQRRVIVSRLSIPAQGLPKPYLYTGALNISPRFMAWQFRQENETFRDIATIIVESGNPTAPGFERTGVMATLGQDKNFSPITYDILLRRENGDLPPHLVAKFLDDTARCEADDEAIKARLRVPIP